MNPLLSRRLLLGSALLPLAAAPHAMAQPASAQPASAQPASAQPVPEALRRAREAEAGMNPRASLALDRTMERLAEMGVDWTAPRLILVNIAAAEMIAFEAGREIMRSRVVVGTPRNRTPQLLTFATSVRCNPPWHVPPSILAEIRASGAGGFQAVGGRLIQPPGPNNPLGPLRLGLLDSDGIFLHGTNRPALFAREARTLSHGCVRVEAIRDLCAWVLDMPAGDLQAQVATGRTIELHPLQEVQVVLAYLTAWPDASGRVVAYPDPYGHDARRASFRRVPRSAPDDPLEVEAAARATMLATGRI
ncbi:L,D-transpeptidase family protein [Sediminicoccus sp. KRV36]|uniref:L,D-transpeptidase family protein n=1 Tax=Sediminicoccus sp. KRV36 TaxID=3133721 RepID=UPI00200F6BA6|nr:L,D-transpeptidase family protein [Sediminicoccus rosea]UPY35435.1 L,D-transpeptidase family protein [Sediminicoccus rosea]